MNLVSLENFLDNTSFLVLFLTMLVYWAGAAFPSIPLLPGLGSTGVAIANLCIAALLGARWLEAGYFPISNLYESLFFLAWGVTAVHLIAEYTSRSRLVGVVTTPVAMGITAFATLSLPGEMQTSAPLVPALKSNWLMMHVSVILTPTLTAMATLSPQRLSLAETLDNISYRVIGLGFPLLTIGIIAGAVWANEAWGSYWSWDPKETWALITWLVFAAYLHARITRGWQGRKPAILAASGFVVVWVCYLGVNLLGKGLHSYGWFF